jgi:50S ribosomal protein L16 3-hydroxylase
MIEDAGEETPRAARNPLYRDPMQPATLTPAALPAELVAFARQSIADAFKDPLAFDCALGESLTEPKASIFFDEPAPDGVGESPWQNRGVVLDPKTRMMYGAHHVFINGESYQARGTDAALMRKLADQRCLRAQQLVKASSAARDLLDDWHAAGWLRTLDDLNQIGP